MNRIERRAEFAKAALTGFIAGVYANPDADVVSDANIARYVFEYADAMLLEFETRPMPPKQYPTED